MENKKLFQIGETAKMFHISVAIVGEIKNFNEDMI